jgi:transcriptional regulator with XRE-family HTH domain
LSSEKIEKTRFIMDWSEKVRFIEQILGTTTAQLARYIDVEARYLHEIKSGKTKNPGALFLQKLIQNLNINPTWLLTGEGEMFLPGKDPRKPQNGNVVDLAGPPREEKSDTVSDLGTAPPAAEKSATVADLAKPQAAEPGKYDTVSDLDTAPQGQSSLSALPAGLEPPKRIRRISMELQGLADELDVGGPVPARLRPLVRRVARLDDEDLAKTTAYVDDLLQKVKYAQGEEPAEADTSQGGAAAAGIA